MVRMPKIGTCLLTAELSFLAANVGHCVKRFAVGLLYVFLVRTSGHRSTERACGGAIHAQSGGLRSHAICYQRQLLSKNNRRQLSSQTLFLTLVVVAF